MTDTFRAYLATPTLTDQERDVLVRRYVLDYSAIVIADELRITVRAVNLRLANARRKIVDHHHLTPEEYL